MPEICLKLKHNWRPKLNTNEQIVSLYFILNSFISNVCIFILWLYAVVKCVLSLKRKKCRRSSGVRFDKY